MSKENKVKLGKRLAAVESAVSGHYDHIWDCCCDHGLLGFRLLNQDKASHIHFVDIVPQLLFDIEEKLSRFYQGKNRWHVHCLDVANLPLKNYPTEKHLIIIAGIGGQLLIDLLDKLLSVVGNMNVEFILSPVHHNYQLRQFLNQQKCALIDEFIVAENERFYEVIHIDNVEGKDVSLVGDKMWDFDSPLHQSYLQQTINHYQRMSQNPTSDVSGIIRAYQTLYLLK